MHAATAPPCARTGHADQDSFISKTHSERLVAAYAGDKELVAFDGDHNSHRPHFFYASVLSFLHSVLQVGLLPCFSLHFFTCWLRLAAVRVSEAVRLLLSTLFLWGCFWLSGCCFLALTLL
jgi:hypothetical protein